MTALDDPEALEAVLARWVAERLQAESPDSHSRYTCSLLGPPPSGNSNITLPFVVRWNDDGSDAPPAGEIELVLRMQHPDNQIFFDADVLREFSTLRALAGDDTVAAPSPRWQETDPMVLGHPFFVMERITGSVPAGMPSIHVTGWLSQQDTARQRTAWDSALEAMAAVHRFDWQSRLPALAQEPNGTTIEQRLEHLTRWYRWVARGREFPVTDIGLHHLQSTVADLSPAASVMLWGDARLGNTMFDDNAHVAAVLDWELASIGPAGVDLGWWLVFEEFSTTAHGVTRLPGIPDRATTLERYTALSGEEITDIEWYETFAEWMITVTVIRMADIGVAAGRLSAATRMGQGNLTAQMLARRLGLDVPDLDHDYALRRGLAESASDTN